MENSPKKFCIPQSVDNSFDDPISSAPRCFKPGLLNNEQLADKSSLSDSNEKSIVKDASNSKSREQLQSHKEPSRFENEFRSLTDSKFYESETKRTLTVAEKQEKIIEKPLNFSALLVNPRQRGNPLLKSIRNVPWEFTEIEPDYQMGKTSCALFLSLRYHNLFPNYIHDRLKALGRSYNLRVLLVQVDVAEPNPPLKDLSVISILADCTLMVAWSAEEAGNYLETYKIFENKSADLIKEKQQTENISQLIDCLTTIRSVNKTDAMVLISNFKTLKGIINSSIEELTQCPGMGPVKAKRVYDALRKPLRNEYKNV